jgi:ABC-type sugar transport system ATPase subunit
MTNTPESSSLSAPEVEVPAHELEDSGVSSSSGSLLQLKGITKNFGAVQALKRVDLEVPAGKVTALIGDNGAGKSTLIKAIAGIYAPTSGQILWNGQEVHIHTPRDAERLGIATVYQDLALCDNLDVVQNMYLGHEETRHYSLDEITMEIATKKVLADLSVTTVRSVRQKVASLSGGQRQSIAVAKAVMRDSKLVILDEPTAALGVSQTAQVLKLIQTLASRGIAVLLISHNLNDVFAVADRVAVMYLGTLVSSGPVGDYDTASAVDWITTGAARSASPLAPAN